MTMPSEPECSRWSSQQSRARESPSLIKEHHNPHTHRAHVTCKNGYPEKPEIGASEIILNF